MPVGSVPVSWTYFISISPLTSSISVREPLPFFCVPLPVEMCKCKIWTGHLKVQLLWLTLVIVIFVQFLIIKPTRCTNFSSLFLEKKTLHVSDNSLSIIRSSSLYTQQWYMFYTFADILRAGSGRSVLILLACCMTYTVAVCTVKNSWWWTKELSETCRVLFQK